MSVALLPFTFRMKACDVEGIEDSCPQIHFFFHLWGWGLSATVIAMRKIASSNFHLLLIGSKGTIQDNDLSEP